MFSQLALLVGLIGLVSAISWPLILDGNATNGNVWIEIVYTIHVPPAPPSDVNSGPWYFWCGLQPQGGGVVQPVLTWGENAPGYSNPNPPFPEIWAMVLWNVPAEGMNGGQSAISDGIWAEEGAQIACRVTYDNGQWTQTATVISGSASGTTTIEIVSASEYFPNSAGDSNANFFLCESELDGQQTQDWDFPVLITDLFVRAQTSVGVYDLCSAAKSSTDGNGFADVEGFSMQDSNTCHFASITLTPPNNVTGVVTTS